jgi:hypothetical protein
MKQKKHFKKGGGAIENIFTQSDIKITADTDLYDEIIKILDECKNGKDENINVISDFCTRLYENKNEKKNKNKNFFKDIVMLILKYDATKEREINFQSNIKESGKDLFGFYELFAIEDSQKFITIDPTIIQIMIFDANLANDTDIVYSLKLIIRSNKLLTVRYTTQLFPNNSKITNFNNLDSFNTFNMSLGNDYINGNYENQLIQFLKQYIKFYEFYKKCYVIEESSRRPAAASVSKKIIDYQLKYISILGKARFGKPEVQSRTAIVTDYVMSNLLFATPTYGFISGGYKGFNQYKFGVTRSGYEISKKYNRPILTIMCNEGRVDSHQYSDATLIYGEHWGEDSIALSQLTDGAIIIAPFGGWTYIECLTLLQNEKIVGIYNDLYNILNYKEKATIPTAEMAIALRNERTKNYQDSNITDEDIKKDINNKNANAAANIYFFTFTKTEQNNIIDYYINYYLILLYLLKQDSVEEDQTFIQCLELGIKILMVIKDTFNTIAGYRGDMDIIIPTLIIPFTNTHIAPLIEIFNTLKTEINTIVNTKLQYINDLYLKKCSSEYQSKIPQKCDGIWIKPLFNLITCCIKQTTAAQPAATQGTSGGSNKNKYKYKKGGCDVSGVSENIKTLLNSYTIDYNALQTYALFNNLNKNIIFVFSDAMYLTMYLNENLNTINFQTQIQQKIAKLSKIVITPRIRGSTPLTVFGLVRAESQKIIQLNRNMDGFINSETNELITNHIIRGKYTFIIDDECKNYTSLVDYKPLV